jgi:hypothetical protein
MMLAISTAAFGQIRFGGNQGRWSGIAPESNQQHEIGEETAHCCAGY